MGYSQYIPPIQTVNVPINTIKVPTPIRYYFRVLEVVNEQKQIVRVELQMKIDQLDQYGEISLGGIWEKVDRIRQNENGDMIYD